MLTLYTDGGVMGNGDAEAYGAWAYCASDGREASGPMLQTTNNRSELQAIIEALKYAKATGDADVLIISDSQLCINCASGRWKRKANLDQWREYADAAEGMTVRFEWVRGHSGVAGNERADELCGIEMLQMEAGRAGVR